MQSVRIDGLDPNQWSELPIPAEQVQSGTPNSQWHVLYEADNGKFLCAVWRCTPCVFRWNYDAHEMVTVLSGRATVAIEDGPRVELEPGTVAHFLPGEKAVWTIHETTTKTFVVSK